MNIIKMTEVTIVTLIMQTMAQAACPEIAPRAEWGARPATRVIPMKKPVGDVFIHHTVGSQCGNREECSRVLKQTQNYHMDTNRWPDIGYSFLIGGDGVAYEGVGWDNVGSHTFNWNEKSIGISYMGNFQEVPPNEAMLKAGRSLIDCGVEQGHLTPERLIHGHKDASCTDCPGLAFYEIIKSWPGFQAGPLAGYKC